MTEKPITNHAASNRQKLHKIAKNTGRPFQEVLQYFAMERFLYRLSQSPYNDKFVLKGALMFTAWGGPASRPRKDIDFLARMENFEVSFALPTAIGMRELHYERDLLEESMQGKMRFTERLL